MDILINESFAKWLEETHNITYLNIVKLQEQYLKDKGDECCYFSNGYCNNLEYPLIKCESKNKNKCMYNKL